MENPMTWGPAERTVREILDRQENILPRIRPLPQGQEAFCGLSLERQITDALRQAGLLKEEENAKEEEERPGRTPHHQPHPGD